MGGRPTLLRTRQARQGVQKDFHLDVMESSKGLGLAKFRTNMIYWAVATSGTDLRRASGDGPHPDLDQRRRQVCPLKASVTCARPSSGQSWLSLGLPGQQELWSA